MPRLTNFALNKMAAKGKTKLTPKIRGSYRVFNIGSEYLQILQKRVKTGQNQPSYPSSTRKRDIGLTVDKNSSTQTTESESVKQIQNKKDIWR